MSWAALLLVALGAGDAGQVAPPLGLTARVEPQQVKLGEPFTYEVVVTHDPSQRYELLVPSDTGAFSVAQVQRRRTDARDGRAVTTFRAQVALFDLGPKPLPPFELSVQDGAGEGKLLVPPAQVEGVSSLPPDAQQEGADLIDIKPPVDVPVRTYRLIWWMLALLAAAGAGYWLYRYLRRARLAPVVVEPPKPLDVRTRAALDALRDEDLPGRGEVKAHYFRLSEIVRAYLGERYGFEALECTRSELLEAVQKLPAPGLPLGELTAFVDHADLVKFAKAEATPAQCQQALAFGYSLLERTWPPPPPPTPAAPHAPGPVAP